MMRAVAIVLISFMSGTQAQANNPLDDLNRALNDLNQVLRGEIPTGPTSKARTQPDEKITIHHGVCAAFNWKLKEILRERCRAKATCDANGDCEVRYTIDRMYLAAEFTNGRLTRFWNQQASWVTIEGHACMKGKRSGISLCFIEDGASTRENQDTVKEVPDVDDADKKAQARERRRTEAIELSRRLKEEQEEAQAQKETEQLRRQAEAELFKKRQLIEEAIGADKVGRFFEGMTPSRLAPVNAKHECREHFLPQLAEIINPVPVEALEVLRQRCKAAGDNYAKAEAELAGERQAQVLLKIDANLEGLRTNNWFLFSSDHSDDFSTDQKLIASRVFQSLTDAHRREAIETAKAEIRTAYQNARPLSKSANEAWKKCNLPNKAPAVLRNICGLERKKFDELTAAARCRQSIDQSNVSRKTLDMPFAVSGDRLVSWPLRQVICMGAKKRPQYRIIVDESWIPGLRPTTLTIFESRDRKLLEVELRVSSSRDGRSFTQLLIDIATGENEKPVLKELVVNKIRHMGAGVKGRGSDAIVGCTLGFVRCR